MGALVVLGACAIAPAMVILTNTRARLLFVVCGAVLVFQSGSDVGATKIAYLAGLAFVVALTMSDRATPLKRRSVAVGLVFSILCVASVVRGNEAVWVLRDASNYVLLVSAAHLAQHFSRLPSRFLYRCTLAIGVFGCYAFSAQWISHRGLGSLPTPGLPSTVLMAVGVASASAKATLSGRPARWMALVAALLSMALLSGTRNTVLLALAPAAILLRSSIRGTVSARRAARRALRVGVVVVPLAAVLAVSVAPSIGIDVDAAFSRISTLVDFDREGASDSLTERRIQQDLAFQAFKANPLLGAGPGTLWTWESVSSGRASTGIALDTSLVVPAKWGLLGSLALAYLLWQWWTALRRPRGTAWDFPSLVVVGVVPVLLAQSVLAPVIEDRGLPLALVLLGATKLALAREQAKEQESVTEPSVAV